MEMDKGEAIASMGCDARESFEYMIQQLTEEPHKSRFSDRYFERVILFAQSNGIDRLWIDK
jgi:hypothetical protein